MWSDYQSFLYQQITATTFETNNFLHEVTFQIVNSISAVACKYSHIFFFIDSIVQDQQSLCFKNNFFIHFGSLNDRYLEDQRHEISPTCLARLAIKINLQLLEKPKSISALIKGCGACEYFAKYKITSSCDTHYVVEPMGRQLFKDIVNIYTIPTYIVYEYRYMRYFVRP